jgi:hypothetical protein
MRSSDGRLFSPLGVVLNPVGAADPLLWRDLDALGGPFAELVHDVDGRPLLRLWIDGHGSESAPSIQFGKPVPIPPNHSIGLFTSSDGRNFVAWPFNPVFDRVVDFLSHPSELEPAVVTLGDERLLYYRAADFDGGRPRNLGVARAPVEPAR